MIWEYVLNDLMEPLSFIPQGILISLAVVWAGMLFQKSAAGRKKKSRWNKWRQRTGKNRKGKAALLDEDFLRGAVWLRGFSDFLLVQRTGNTKCSESGIVRYLGGQSTGQGICN